MNTSLIDSAVLVPGLAASDKKSALEAALAALVEAGKLAKRARADVLAQLMEREEQGSTGLGNGVAVPHVKETRVEEITLAVGIATEGIGFDAIDGRPVHILFIVLGPKGGAPETHLGVLRWVSSLARNADFRRFARAVSTADELRDLLHEMTGSL